MIQRYIKRLEIRVRGIMVFRGPSQRSEIRFGRSRPAMPHALRMMRTVKDFSVVMEKVVTAKADIWIGLVLGRIRYV